MVRVRVRVRFRGVEVDLALGEAELGQDTLEQIEHA